MDTVALKKRRCSKGFFTQAAMARAIEMAPTNYGNRENGKIKFKAAEIQKLCEKLDWTLEEGLKYLS